MEVPLLKNLCIKYVAENFNSFVTQCSDCEEPKWVWRFPSLNCRIPSPSADMILKEVAERKILKSEQLTLFSQESVNLHSVFLHDIDLTPSSLRFLRNFTLLDIHFKKVRGIALKDIIDNLSKNTFHDLRCLSVENIPFYTKVEWSVSSALGKFKNILLLNISGTKLNTRGLGELVKFLPQLKALDISETEVDNICCLKGLKENLVALVVHNLPLDINTGFETALTTLLELKKLRYLDVSNHNRRASIRFPIVDRLIESQSLQCLEYLNYNGNPFLFTYRDIQKFIENHPALKLVGLIGCTDLWTVINETAKYPNIMIIGGRGEKNSIEMVKQCLHRTCCLESVFYSIMDDIENGFRFSLKINKTVIDELEKLDIPSPTPFDFKRCYTVICRNLELSNNPVIWTLALDLQNECIEHMSKTEIDEVSDNSSCMKCLLKYAAEVYLGESEVNALISAHGEERLSYLRNFLRIHDNNNRVYSELSDEIVIEMIQKLANNRPHVCENVVNYGGYEILTKILQM
ncbi:hypothetical protein ACTXT7_013177 [Hymenolepis weldensis]